ncbi:MAG: AI-2E family transporter [Actinobacteria bacterium]|nr:AI-2E family transporter [Actinomycetota bacterium]
MAAYDTDVARPDPVPAAPGPSAKPPPVRIVDLDWRSVLVVLAAFVGLIALTGLVRSVPRTTSALGIALILALALNPLVERAQRGLHVARREAVAAVLVLVGVVFGAVALLVVPPGVRQARQLGTQLPDVVRQLDRLPVVGERLDRANAPEKVQRWIERLPDRLAGDTTPLERAARNVADGVLAAVVTLLFTVTLMLDGPRLVAAGRRLAPLERRDRLDHLGLLAYRIVGRYVAGSLLVAVVAGVVVLAAGLALRVPLTPLAALWALLWDLVPQIGGAVGVVPFVLLGLTRGAGTAVGCLVVFMVYQQLKHQVLQPVLIGQAVKLSPAATMIAALVGVSAGGVVGALLAVPAVGAAKAVYLELRSPSA